MKETGSSPESRHCGALVGVLLGTAVGDSVGLPAEGLSRSRIKRLWDGRWRHRFLFGRGMCSDDTEHTLFVAQALLAHPDDPAAFQKCLAWKLRLWLLGLPAGIGFATLRAVLKLWLGFPPTRSGVRSAGNGPAMRSAIIGAYFANEIEKRRAFVAASTQITHTDPRAGTAALAVADATAWAVEQNEPREDWVEKLAQLGLDEEWRTICTKLRGALTKKDTVGSFAEWLGLTKGMSGYAYHSVPVALYSCLRHPDDFRAATEAALNCGGDTDTLGAIVGAVMGARKGNEGIPGEWLNGICEWPRSRAVLEEIAARLARQKITGPTLGPVSYCWPALIVRNIVFLMVVLVHAFRRMAPPY